MSVTQDEIADYSLRTLDSKKLKAQLEVSGIWKETKGNTSNNRVRIKLSGLSKDASIQTLPVYVVVTEFSSPKSKIKKHER